MIEKVALKFIFMSKKSLIENIYSAINTAPYNRLSGTPLENYYNIPDCDQGKPYWIVL